MQAKKNFSVLIIFECKFTGSLNRRIHILIRDKIGSNNEILFGMQICTCNK